MQKKNVLIVTGITGFIGTNIANSVYFNQNFEIYGLSSKKFFKLESKLTEIDEDYFYQIIKNREICLLHLATFYSLNENEKKKILDSNLEFGIDFFNTLLINKVDIKSILYTNTVFSFSENEKIKKSTYVITKNKFSRYLRKVSLEKNINLVEVYLDNTFGKDDKRKKIIPSMINAASNNLEIEIKNPDSYINLTPVSGILKIFEQLIDKQKNCEVAIFSPYEYKLDSINAYIREFFNNGSSLRIEKNKFNVPASLPKYVEKIFIEIELESELENILTELI